MARPDDAELAGDGGGGGGVVAGDHPDPDAGLAALGDGGFGLGPGWVDDPGHGQQGQVGDQAEQVAGGVEAGRVQVPGGHHHDPLAPLGHAVIGLGGQGAVVVGDRDQGPIRVPVGPATGDQHIGGALDIAAHHRLAARAGHVVEGGHELVVRIKGDLSDPGVAGPGLVDVQPTLGREHDQGPLGRVTDQVGAVQDRIRAQDHRQQIRVKVDVQAADMADLPLGRIALPGDTEPMLTGDGQLPGGHLVQRQGAGLVTS